MLTIANKQEQIALQHILIDARDAYRKQRSTQARHLALTLSRWVKELDA